jgi:hypothetical protein
VVCTPGEDPVSLTIEPGEVVPVGISWCNDTGGQVTFTATMQENPIFGEAETVFQLTVPEDDCVEIFVPKWETPRDAIPGTAVVQLFITSNATGSEVLEVCNYLMTVLPPEELRQLIQIPVRWCVMEGTPQADGMPRGEAVSGQKLATLLQRINDRTWLPYAKILFRPAGAPDGIPVIADPVLDIGLKGEVSLATSYEATLAAMLCQQEWAGRYPGRQGLPVLNLRGFVNDFQTQAFATGAPKALWVQQGSDSYTGRRGDDLCGHPRNLSVADVTDQFAGVVDEELGGGLSRVVALAHELGHTLMLGHGNGLDDDGNGLEPPEPGPRRFDEYCDPAGLNDVTRTPYEDRLTGSCDSDSLMRSMQSDTGCTNLQPLQVEQTREVAKVLPGALFDEAEDPAGALVASFACGTPPCELPPEIFLVRAQVALTPSLGETEVSHTVLGPLDGEASYTTFLDLDDAADTGCAPAEMGFDTQFQGAELVTRVVLSANAGQPDATAAVWRCRDGVLVPVSDPSIRAFAGDGREATSGNVLFGTVTLRLSDAVRGPIEGILRIQALAESLDISAARDRLPPAPDAGGRIPLSGIELASCAVLPPISRPGGVVRIATSNLPPDTSIDVFLEGEVISSGRTDETGAAEINLAVPARLSPGVRSILLETAGPTEFAACALLVEGSPLTPATTPEVAPEVSAAGWHNTDVAVTLIAVPSGASILSVTYAAEGAHTIPPMTVEGAIASVELTNEGETVLEFFATDEAGVKEAPQRLVVRIDKTPPAVTYVGNAGTYRITDFIEISCTASDALSGVISDTCQQLVGPAWSFQPGTNTFFGEATDRADNVGQGFTSFEVVVSFDDLCALTSQFLEESNPEPLKAQYLGRSLCRHLAVAEKAAAIGKSAPRAVAISAYLSQLEAVAERFFTGAQAATLQGWAEVL